MTIEHHRPLSNLAACAKPLAALSSGVKRLSRASRALSSWHLAHSFVGPVVLSAVFGCGSESADEMSKAAEEISLGEAEQPLYGETDVFWTGAPPMIPVCWEPGTFDNASQAPLRGWIEDAARRNWNRFARLNLVGKAGASTWQRCLTSDSGIHAYFSPGICGGHSAGIGTGISGIVNGLRLTDCGTGCEPHPSATQEQCVRRVGMHEFGHTLGYYHEEERPFEPLRDCNDTPQVIAGGTKYGAYNDGSFMAECTSTLTAVDQTPGDIAGLQRGYGRRVPGSMVTPYGRCAASVAAASGDAAFIFDCDEFENDQKFEFLLSTGQFRARLTNLCLRASTAAGGGAATLTTCDTSLATQRWSLSNVFIRGWGGLCLDLAGGNTSGGNVQVFTCGALGGGNQRWRILSGPTNSVEIRFGTSNACLTAGSPLTVQNCTGAVNQRFRWRHNGQLESDSQANTCADVVGVNDAQYMSGLGMPTSGAAVNLFTCQDQSGVWSGGTMTLNQVWNVSGPITHSNGNCLRRSGTGNAANLNTGSCNGSDLNETWDYYPRVSTP